MNALIEVEWRIPLRETPKDLEQKLLALQPVAVEETYGRDPYISFGRDGLHRFRERYSFNSLLPKFTEERKDLSGRHPIEMPVEELDAREYFRRLISYKLQGKYLGDVEVVRTEYKLGDPMGVNVCIDTVTGINPLQWVEFEKMLRLGDNQANAESYLVKFAEGLGVNVAKRTMITYPEMLGFGGLA